MGPSCPRVRRGGIDAGFTLVELLVVMGIMGVLAGAVVSAVRYAHVRGRFVKARSNIASLSVALEAYGTVNGCLPGGASPGKAQDDPWALFLGLYTGNPALGGSRENHVEDWPADAIGKWSGSFVEVYARPTDEELDFSGGVRARSVFLDPWGRAFHYVELDGRAPEDRRLANGRFRARSGQRFAIWSDGPDGINEYGEGDDVSSWNEGGA